jgi:hypothetical protein
MYGHQYTQAQIRFINKKIAGRSVAEMTKLFNKHFGISLTVGQMKSFIGNHHLRNGLCGRFSPGLIPHNKGVKGLHYSRATEWMPGHKPWNYEPIGSERITRDGYLEIKIAAPRFWKGKHILIWEKANGAVPKGIVIIFADGDKTNFKLKNLLMISRGELAVMNHCGLIYNNADFTKTGKIIADLKIKISERNAEIKKCKKRRRKGGRK